MRIPADLGFGYRCGYLRVILWILSGTPRTAKWGLLEAPWLVEAVQNDGDTGSDRKNVAEGQVAERFAVVPLERLPDSKLALLSPNVYAVGAFAIGQKWEFRAEVGEAFWAKRQEARNALPYALGATLAGVRRVEPIAAPPACAVSFYAAERASFGLQEVRCLFASQNISNYGKT